MAKGNNGNLLQHAVEAEAACSLCTNGQKGLYLVSTHGMAPYESFGRRNSACRLLDFWLKLAAETDTIEKYPAVATAYRFCHASPLYYPNTAEIVAAIADELAGVITEIDGTKVAKLNERWENTNIQIRQQSWRCDDAESISPPNGLAFPWLISLDPMTFSSAPDGDDDRFRRQDFELLRPKWNAFVNSEQHGVMCVFCYSMRPDTVIAFRQSANECIPHATFIDTLARKGNKQGNKHCVAIWATSASIISRVKAAWACIESF